MNAHDFLPLSAPMYAVLITIGDGAMHGLGIIQTFEESTGQSGALLPGSLYNTIARMSKQGLLEEVAPPIGDRDDRKRYYAVTELGRAVRSAESARLRTLLALADRGGLAPSS
ncbi:MAG: PadR family transcriptional regulator [Gemmatimonadota bacterium]